MTPKLSQHCSILASQYSGHFRAFRPYRVSLTNMLVFRRDCRMQSNQRSTFQFSANRKSEAESAGRIHGPLAIRGSCKHRLPRQAQGRNNIIKRALSPMQLYTFEGSCKNTVTPSHRPEGEGSEGGDWAGCDVNYSGHATCSSSHENSS